MASGVGGLLIADFWLLIELFARGVAGFGGLVGSSAQWEDRKEDSEVWKQGTRKSPELADWKVCPTWRRCENGFHICHLSTGG